MHWSRYHFSRCDCRAEGALSILAPENIVENTSVLKKKKKSEATSNSRSENKNDFGQHIFLITLLISPGASLLCNISCNKNLTTTRTSSLKYEETTVGGSYFRDLVTENQHFQISKISKNMIDSMIRNECYILPPSAPPCPAGLVLVVIVISA